MDAAKPPLTKPTVIDYQPDHHEAVFRLYAEVFGQEGSANFRARWRWSQVENQAPEETQRWVLVTNDRVVGFLATVPLPYRVGGRDVLVKYSCDFMVHPEFRFYGLALMRAYMKTCSHCVSLDDIGATIAILKMMGATPIGNSQGYARPLDTSALIRRDPRLRHLPGFALSGGDLALRTYDRARALACLSRIEEVPDFDARFDRFFWRCEAVTPVTLRRGSAFLNWRYGPNSPHAGRRIGVVLDSRGEIEGYIVACASTAAQRWGHVFELHGLPELPRRHYAALLLFACRVLRNEGCSVLRLFHFETRTTAPVQALKEVHFMRRQHQHTLLAKFGEASLNALALDSKNWSYSFGDAEASYSL